MIMEKTAGNDKEKKLIKNEEKYANQTNLKKSKVV